MPLLPAFFLALLFPWLEASAQSKGGGQCSSAQEFSDACSKRLSTLKNVGGGGAGKSQNPAAAQGAALSDLQSRTKDAIGYCQDQLKQCQSQCGGSSGSGSAGAQDSGGDSGGDGADSCQQQASGGGGDSGGQGGAGDGGGDPCSPLKKSIKEAKCSGGAQHSAANGTQQTQQASGSSDQGQGSGGQQQSAQGEGEQPQSSQPQQQQQPQSASNDSQSQTPNTGSNSSRGNPADGFNGANAKAPLFNTDLNAGKSGFSGRPDGKSAAAGATKNLGDATGPEPGNSSAAAHVGGGGSAGSSSGPGGGGAGAIAGGSQGGNGAGVAAAAMRSLEAFTAGSFREMESKLGNIDAGGGGGFSYGSGYKNTDIDGSPIGGGRAPAGGGNGTASVLYGNSAVAGQYSPSLFRISTETYMKFMIKKGIPHGN